MADHPGLRMLGQRVTITERDHPWFGYSGVVDKAVWFKMADPPEPMVEVHLDNGMGSAVGVRGLSLLGEP